MDGQADDEFRYDWLAFVGRFGVGCRAVAGRTERPPNTTGGGTTMKVKIDADLCTACGLCTDSVPQVFKMGKDVAEVIAADVPANLEGAVKDAASDCPAEAILIS
jgi:ferredoxin